MDLQAERVEQGVRDTILIVLYLHCFIESINGVIHMEGAEGVVDGHVGSSVFIETPGLGVAVTIIFEVT